ncbi:methyltransferase domain-containing protein [Spirillospora albida]|uniref:methyltransferase domain-containing protein n=1 Tax=Spirillospora albida TaxID=58123 RepID=UPI0004C0D924|nr:methyltransferase domain-containing protein [Spirillospora albida]
MSNETIEALIAQLDVVDGSPGADALRARSYELLRPLPDGLVVDVGCGTGRAVAELADRGARATGIDVSDQMIALARQRWPHGEFHGGDACALPLRDGQATGYRADKVIHALPDPGRALAEARRVLAPDGRIVLCGQDWDTFVIDSTDPELTRTIVHRRADLVPSPRAARRYRNLLLDAGFRDVTVEVHTAVFTDDSFLPVLTNLAETCREHGAITAAEAEAWIADQQERARTDRLFAAVPLFMAAATNP